MKSILLTTAVMFFSICSTKAQNKDIENKIRELEKNESEAVVKHDSAALERIWADDFIVNTPYNFVGQRKRGDAITLYYARLDRNIEKLIVYNDSLVMTMGNEVVFRKPPMTYAGLTLTRRYSHVWMKRNGKWQLAIRHANFICAEVKQ